MFLVPKTTSPSSGGHDDEKSQMGNDGKEYKAKKPYKESSLPLVHVSCPQEESKTKISSETELPVPSLQISIDEEDSTLGQSIAMESSESTFSLSPLQTCPSNSPSGQVPPHPHYDTTESDRNTRNAGHSIQLSTLLQVPGGHPRRRHSWICRYEYLYSNIINY
ncbi:UNVERIFIED_CONTAM: hypothetical protein RMT77_009987 [Armadillidium vulgare]